MFLFADDVVPIGQVLDIPAVIDALVHSHNGVVLKIFLFVAGLKVLEFAVSWMEQIDARDEAFNDITRRRTNWTTDEDGVLTLRDAAKDRVDDVHRNYKAGRLRKKRRRRAA